MSVELDVFKMIDVVADKPQNSPPLSKEIEGLIEVRALLQSDDAGKSGYNRYQRGRSRP